MKIGASRVPRAAIPLAPMASVALLGVLFITMAGFFQADRGLLIRFQGDETTADPSWPEDAIRAEILPDSSIVVDGKHVPLDRLLNVVEPNLSRDPDRVVMLYANDDAPYGAVVAVVDLLSRPDAGRGVRVRRLWIPTHREMAEHDRLFGRDPFEPRPAGR